MRRQLAHMIRVGPLRIRLRLSPFLALSLALMAVHACSAGELRGIWVDDFGPGFFDPHQVKKLAENCRKHNFNAVFVEMRRRGDAFYFPKANAV